jgi:hypothetical protein
MCGRLPRFTISSLTVHRFLIASVCVSTKALCDAFCANSHYAKIGGIKLVEFNVLEREFLSALDWHLIVCIFLLTDTSYEMNSSLWGPSGRHIVLSAHQNSFRNITSTSHVHIPAAPSKWKMRPWLRHVPLLLFVMPKRTHVRH